MPPSTTTWAAALLLASMSGSVLTTADALPAGPQETALRPRYYFPRHVKRQFANTTEPATPASSSSTLPNQSRQSSKEGSNDASSFFESLLHLSPSPADSSVDTVVVSPSPVTSSENSENDPVLTENVSPRPSSEVAPSDPVSPSLSLPDFGSTGALPIPFITSSATSAASASGVPETEPSPDPSPSSPDSSSSTTATTIQGPFIIPTSLSEASPSASSSGLPSNILSSLLGGIVPTSSGSSFVLTGTGSATLSLPTSGIVVGITTAFGTSGASTTADPTPSASVIPTSEASSALSLDLSSVLSSIVSDVTSALNPTSPVATVTASASGISGPATGSTAPTVTAIPTSEPSSAPTASASLSEPNVSGAISSIISDLTSLISGTGATTAAPTTTSDSLAIPTSEGPTSTPTDASSSLPSGTSASGILPSGSVSGTGVTPSPTTTDSPTSAVPTTTADGITAPSSLSGTGINPTSVASTSVQSSPTSIAASETPSPTTTASKTKPPESIIPISSDSATSLVVPSSIVVEPSTFSTASATAMPSGVAPWIQPPGGMPSEVPKDMFLGQIGFDYGLNYKFVAQSGNSNQIFTFLRQAIAQAIGVQESDVVNYGLRAADTTQYKGWVTTLAVFMIPKDKNTTLETQLGQPAASFYHNVDQNGNPRENVNQLTALVDPTWPLPYGSLPDGSGTPATNSNSQTPGSSGAPGQGGALPGDTSGSRKINPTSVGIATGAVLAAVAYGAAMFLVARRYRNKKAAHRRASSVPSESGYTYGSVGNGNWMTGARYGRMTPSTPGSRGSQGSNSSNDRSVRTQQISAPVMAENSLGWN